LFQCAGRVLDVLLAHRLVREQFLEAIGPGLD
jgi:hypothetical protein